MEEEREGGSGGEGLGDGEEGLGGEAGFVGDGVDGFPFLRAEFGTEFFEAFEVIEAAAVSAGPVHEEAKPSGVLGDGWLGLGGERDEAEGGVGAVLSGEGLHGGVDEEFGGAVGGGGVADDLFDEEAVALGDGRGEEEADDGGIVGGAAGGEE